jgi:hypothetical protein
MTTMTKRWKEMTVDEKFEQHTLELSEIRNRISVLQMQITQLENTLNEIQTKLDLNQ